MTVRNLLLLPHLKIINANALSSPYTIGFPAMTAWLGAAHALQRRLNDADYTNLRVHGVGVVCHSIDVQTYRDERHFEASIIGTGNPLNKKGERPSFVEEPRCHLEVSLVLEYTGLGLTDKKRFEQVVADTIHQHLRFAGGDFIGFSEAAGYGRPTLFQLVQEGDETPLFNRLMPGYALIERRDLMQQAMQAGMDSLDALIDYLSVHNDWVVGDDDKGRWRQSRKTSGWLVPIATGFQGISEIGIADHQRDPDTPHRFAEAVVTLGEFIMPHRLDYIDNLLWQYRTDLTNDLYVCQQKTPMYNVEENTHG